MVSIRKREDPGNECLCAAAIIRIISTCFLGAINLQGKEKSSFFIVFSELCQLYYKESLYSRI